MPKPVRAVLGIALTLGLVFGFMRFLGGHEAQELAGIRRTLESADPAALAVGPLTMDTAICRYFRPGSIDGAMNKLKCPSCLAEVEAIRERFTPVVQEPRCAKRGKNTLVFQRRQ